jgi:hypothetical protein
VKLLRAFCAKAADAGIKLVIILSGIHNSLRLQTQRRFDRALGIDLLVFPSRNQGADGSRSHNLLLQGDFRSGSIDATCSYRVYEHVLLVCKKKCLRTPATDALDGEPCTDSYLF